MSTSRRSLRSWTTGAATRPSQPLYLRPRASCPPWTPRSTTSSRRPAGPSQRFWRVVSSPPSAAPVEKDASMAIRRHVDLLEPVNLAEHFDKLELYLGQVCRVAGISQMQLDYWTNKAQIPTKGRKQRIYG